MRKVISVCLAGLLAVFGFALSSQNVQAEGEEETPLTSLTLTPVSRTLILKSETTYDGTLKVTNDGSDDIRVEVHASPYSYVYSSETDLYQLGFNQENNYTQISRWITIKDTNGNYVENPYFQIPKGETLEIEYKITTPSNIPAGGQYAVLFVQTVSGSTGGGIQAEASAGMLIYGHSSEGETNVSAEIREMKISQGADTETATENNAGTSNGNVFKASAKVKNTGNVDFFAYGKLKVEPIIGFSSYETPESTSTPSVIPESERVVEDEWTEAPSFGIYKVTWTVTAGESKETIEQVFFLIPPAAIIIAIIVLTIIIVLIIMGVRKRKERRSRLAI